LNLRHRIAHGAHPRPVVHNHYTSQLPDFFRRLGRRTDAAVRHRLVRALNSCIAHRPAGRALTLTRRASEGSGALPSLARRVSIHRVRNPSVRRSNQHGIPAPWPP
jgi:hypothetical protein